MDAFGVNFAFDCFDDADLALDTDFPFAFSFVEATEASLWLLDAWACLTTGAAAIFFLATFPTIFFFAPIISGFSGELIFPSSAVESSIKVEAGCGAAAPSSAPLAAAVDPDFFFLDAGNAFCCLLPLTVLDAGRNAGRRLFLLVIALLLLGVIIREDSGNPPVVLGGGTIIERTTFSYSEYCIAAQRRLNIIGVNPSCGVYRCKRG